MSEKFISVANVVFTIIKDDLIHRADQECEKLVNDFWDEIHIIHTLGSYNGPFVSDENKIKDYGGRSFVEHLKYMRKNVEMSDQMYIKLKKYFPI